MQTELITPELADRYLKSQFSNRKVRAKHVESLALEIASDRWQLNGETIKFNRVGQLIDGQHRLLAVIKADKAIESYIVHELSESTVETIDVGLKRSPGDILGLEGYQNGVNLAATLRWLWRYDTDQMVGYGVNPDIATLKTELEKHPEVKNSLSYGSLTAHYITRSLGSALHCLCAEHNYSATERLFVAIKDGDNLKRGEVLYLLRNRLIANSQAKAKIPGYEVAALVIKAFNAVSSGNSLKMLRWRNVEPHKEPFPTIGA